MKFYNNSKYRKYLQTKEWKLISNECKRLANHKCNRCGATDNLQAHHKSYENVFNELQSDLECLCKACHEKEHGTTFTKKSNVPPYATIGNGKETKKGKSMDLIQAIVEMSKLEQVVFNELYQKVKDSLEFEAIDESTIRPKFTYQQKMSLSGKCSKAYKLLESKDIVRRVKRGYYMINPDLLIDVNGYYDREKLIWNDIKHGTLSSKMKKEITKPKELKLTEEDILILKQQRIEELQKIIKNGFPTDEVCKEYNELISD